MANEIQIGAETLLIDLETGKLTRQGLLVLQDLSANLIEFNAHETLVSTTSTLGHTKKGAAVSDGAESTVSVSSADVAAAGVGYDQAYTNTIVALINENKADTNTLVANVNSINTQLNALLSSLKTAGAIT